MATIEGAIPRNPGDPGRSKHGGKQAFEKGVTLDAEDVSLSEMADLARGSIISGQTANNRPTALNAKTSGYILVGDGTDVNSVAVSGDATLSSAGALTVTSLGTAYEVKRVVNADIANAATDSFVFSFVPAYIEIEWHGYAVHDTSSEAGISHGSCLVTITGTDTATSTMTGIHFNNNNSANRWEVTAADATNISIVKAGSDASDQGTITSARTSWTTATKTLLITHTVANTTDASTQITWTARAYA